MKFYIILFVDFLCDFNTFGNTGAISLPGVGIAGLTLKTIKQYREKERSSK